jgi:hypothetical protein
LLLFCSFVNFSCGVILVKNFLVNFFIVQRKSNFSYIFSERYPNFFKYVLIFFSGPINTTLANSVPVSIRARAFSVAILTIHLLGDAISPLLIGLISDGTGSLQAAAVIIPIAIGLACLVWFWGWRFLPDAYTPSSRESADDTRGLVDSTRH